MFSIPLFRRIIKNKFTNSINLTHSDRVSNIIKSNGLLYSVERIFDLVDLPMVAVPTMSKTEDPRVLTDFETIFDLEKDKEFKWFQCLYNTPPVFFNNVIICSSETEEDLYNKLLRFENLKAFL